MKNTTPKSKQESLSPDNTKQTTHHDSDGKPSFADDPRKYYTALRAKKFAMRASADQSSTHPELNIVIKTDVSGSLEALVDLISRFHSPHLTLNIISAGVGGATISDIQLAETVGGLVYCFNTAVPPNVAKQAETMEVELKQYDIIYELLDDLKAIIDDLLPDEVSEVVVGEAEVLAVFRTRGGRVAGCRVTTGQLMKEQENGVWRVVRDGEVLHDNGSITSLKHVKTDINVAKRFSECGVVLKGFNDYVKGDVILCLSQDTKPRTMEWEL